MYLYSRAATCFSGSDAVFKLRCSLGVKIEKFLPESTMPGQIIDNGITASPELELPCVTPDTCIAIELGHRVGGIPQEIDANGNKIEKNPMVYFQTALLYTTSCGRRRVRVTTLGLITSTSPTEIFRSSDFGTLAAVMTRQAIDKVWDQDEGSLHNARRFAVDRCVEILANYRKHTSTKNSSDAQLILPDALQLLPLFCLSLRKSRMFRASLPKNAAIHSTKPRPSVDERAYHILYGALVTPALAMLCVHPLLLKLTNIPDDVGEWTTPQPPEDSVSTQMGGLQISSRMPNETCKRLKKASYSPYVKLPPSVKASIAYLSNDDIFLLDDGFTQFVYIGQDVNDDKRAELLCYGDGVMSLAPGEDLARSEQSVSISKSSTSGAKLWRIVEQNRKLSSMGGIDRFLRPTVTPVVVVIGKGGHGHRKGLDDILENNMIEALIEDPSCNEKSYEDFLCAIHRRIKRLCHSS
jgi:protein transport protein SEC24